MITRIMCVGTNRLNETMATLSFDHNLTVKPDHTHIISPYSTEEVQTAFKQFNLDFTNYTVFNDSYFANYYDLSKWSHDNWYLQQAFKLCALDHFDSTHFLIQDCDLILLKPYACLVDDKLNFKTENLWNPHQQVYGDMVNELLGIKRQIPYSMVNEIMPYLKQDWIELKSYIEHRHNTNFLDALASIRAFDHTKWFSEYELLGIWKTAQPSSWVHFKSMSQPPVDSWEDFYSIDWNQFQTVKFHTPPLKHMTTQEALDLVEYLR